MPSQYEIARRQRQNEARLVQARQHSIDTVRNHVETAISLDEQAGVLEKKIAAYDADEAGHRDRVHRDRADWKLLWVFCGVVVGYVILEFMTSGDIAEMLAYQMAPHFGIDPATGGAPIWLRRAAGVGFVASMLTATLLIKLITTWFAEKFEKARGVLEDGDDQRYWMLTSALWGVRMAKVAYVAAVACLYFWLFGFAQERAAVMEEIATETRQSVAPTGTGLKITEGKLEVKAVDSQRHMETTESKPKDAAATINRLAGATGVFYCVIVLIHALLICLPTDGFSRELEYARFKRGSAVTTTNRMREEERRTLRDIYERIRTAPEHYREDLVHAAEPVHGKINKLYVRPVIGIAGRDQNPAPDDSDSGESATTQPSAGPQSPHGPNGNHAESATEHAGNNGDHDNSPAGEAPAADWDAIFPGRPA